MHLHTLLPQLNVWADMYCMWLSGKWSAKQVWGCGFRLRLLVWQDPEAESALPRCFLPYQLRFGEWRWRGMNEAWERVRWGGHKAKGPGYTLPLRISPARRYNTAHCPQTPTIGPAAPTRSHCGLFYNLEPQFRALVGNQALPRIYLLFFSLKPFYTLNHQLHLT